MSGPQETILKLAPHPVSVVLQNLFAIRQKANQGGAMKVPLTTLHLRSGRDVTGWLISIDERKGDSLVFQRHGPDLRQPDFHILYVDPRDIEAITVHDALPVAESL